VELREHPCQALAGIALGSMRLSVADLAYVGISAAATAILSAVKRRFLSEVIISYTYRHMPTKKHETAGADDDKRDRTRTCWGQWKALKGYVGMSEAATVILSAVKKVFFRI